MLASSYLKKKKPKNMQNKIPKIDEKETINSH